MANSPWWSKTGSGVTLYPNNSTEETSQVELSGKGISSALLAPQESREDFYSQSMPRHSLEAVWEATAPRRGMELWKTGFILSLICALHLDRSWSCSANGEAAASTLTQIHPCHSYGASQDPYAVTFTSFHEFDISFMSAWFWATVETEHRLGDGCFLSGVVLIEMPMPVSDVP